MGWVIVDICDFVCPHSKRKTTWAINTKLGTHIFYGRTLACIDRVQEDKVTGLWSVLPAWVCVSIWQLRFIFVTSDFSHYWGKFITFLPSVIVQVFVCCSISFCGLSVSIWYDKAYWNTLCCKSFIALTDDWVCKAAFVFSCIFMCTFCMVHEFLVLLLLISMTYY